MKIRLPKTGEVNVRNDSPPYVAPKRLACNAIARHNRKCESAEKAYLQKWGVGKKHPVGIKKRSRTLEKK